MIKTNNMINLSEYRKPIFAELEEGDEMVIMTSYGWVNGKWPEVLNEDTHANLFGGENLLQKFNYAGSGLLIKKIKLIE